MTPHKNKIYVILILATLMSSCGLTTNGNLLKENSFEVLYANCDMNSTITFLPLQPNYKFDRYVILSYKNMSENQIAFPPDAGVKIFVYEPGSSNWLEIENNMEYSSSPEPYVFVGSQDGMSHTGILISPNISENPPTEIRVAITGHIYRDGIVTDECVGAFMDIPTS